MTTEETLQILNKVWCDTDDLMKLSQLGINNTTKLKKEMKIDLENQGYLLPKGKLPMIEVIKRLKIDINYLERNQIMKTFEMIQEVKTKDNVINSIMKSNGLYCLVAWPKVGKSFLALQLANSIANNTDFLGYKVKQSPVLYVSTELSEAQLKERLDLTGYKFLPNTFFFIEKDQINKLDIKNDLLLNIKDFSERYNGRFIIIDMMKGIDYGEFVDTNNYTDTSEKIFGKYRELCKKFNLTILVVHHLNKSGNTLGSIGIDGSVNAILTLKNENNNNYTLSINNRDFNDLEINLYKNKNLVFKVVNEDNSELDFNMSVFLRHVIKRKEVVFTPSEIVAELNLQITPTRFGRLLHDSIK